jgi:hypothetical protein
VTVDLSGNNIGCFQPSAGSSQLTLYGLDPCIPTAAPSMMPQQNNSNFKVFYIILIAVAVITILSGIYLKISRKGRQVSSVDALLDADALLKLPIHKAIVEYKSDKFIIETIKANLSIVHARIKSKTALDLALDVDCSFEVLKELLVHFLPYNQDTKEPIESSVHNFSWTKVVEMSTDKAVKLV